MRPTRKYLIFSALVLLLAICGWWTYREVTLRYRQWSYTRDFVIGTRRQMIEDRLLSRGFRFFPESPSVDFVSVGDAFRYTFACASREAGLLLYFKTNNRTSPSADVLEAVKAVREERGCM